MSGELFADVSQLEIGAARQQARQIGRHGADWRCDRHVVVIENDDQSFVARAGIIHGFIGHAGGHRAVADDGNYIVLFAFKIARHCHAKSGGDRSRRMCSAEWIVLALRALGEAG